MSMKPDGSVRPHGGNVCDKDQQHHHRRQQQHEHALPIMATGIDNWVIFKTEDGGGDDVLSLSNFPLVDTGQADNFSHAEAEEFDFFSPRDLRPKQEETQMCAADEVFSQGQILPFRHSCSCGSRSESTERCSSSVSCGSRFETSTSGSTSGRNSRSNSTDSSVTGPEGRPSGASVSYNFFTQPSPKPHVPPRAKKAAASTKGRKSVPASSSASGLGLFRVGVVRAPEMEVDGLRERNRRNGRGTGPAGGGGDHRTEKKGTGLFGCKCSSDDALESIICSPRLVHNTRKGEDLIHGSRNFQWLEELSFTKSSVA